MSRHISNRELAKTLKVTEGAIRKAEKTGRIHRDGNGSWNIEQVRSSWSDNTDNAKQRDKKPDALKPVPEAAINTVQETLIENGQPIGSKSNTTFMQARIADMVLRAQLRKIELEDRKRSLINRAKTLNLVNQLSREDRDSLLNWPARVSSRMAADLDIEPHLMHTILEKYVREHLGERSSREIKID
jgi:hypothetical protein